jgi:hypothetical protein
VQKLQATSKTGIRDMAEIQGVGSIRKNGGGAQADTGRTGQWTQQSLSTQDGSELPGPQTFHSEVEGVGKKHPL